MLCGDIAHTHHMETVTEHARKTMMMERMRETEKMIA
jgi:hypothetical protein